MSSKVRFRARKNPSQKDETDATPYSYNAHILLEL
jgi:hypothetical protein